MKDQAYIEMMKKFRDSIDDFLDAVDMEKAEPKKKEKGQDESKDKETETETEDEKDGD